LFNGSGAPLALWHPRPVRSRALMRGLRLCLVEEIDSFRGHVPPQAQSVAVTVTEAVPKASAADTKCGLSRALDTVRRYRFRLTTVIRNSFRLLTLPEKIPVPSEACSRNHRDRFSFRVRRSECSRLDATLCRNISRPSLDQHQPLARYGVNSCGRGANLSCSGFRPVQPSDDRSYVRLDFV